VAQSKKAPAVTSADRERAERSLRFTERPGNNPACKLHQRRIQFASEEAVDRAGVIVEPVWTGPVREYVASPGEITYDQTRVAHLGSRASGTVWRVYKHLGDPVEAGEVLALIEATEVGKAKSDLLQAVAQAQLRAQTLATARGGSTVLPPARLREAEASYREAQIHVAATRQILVNLGLVLDASNLENLSTEDLEKRLHFAGLPSTITRNLDPQKTTSALLPVVAPMAGVVVSREVVAGEVVDPARVLFEVVDTSRLWLTFHVAVEDARRLRIDQPVEYTPDGSKEPLTARITWISTRADPRTRTVEVRANLPDPEGRQRANTFGTGKIILRDETEVVVVPSEAVHWEGCCHVVFVRDRNYLKPDAPKVFHTRTVRIGAVDTKQTEIIAGVLPGELVAVKNSGVLRAELLRGNLGEG
jgi:cobalt-zinc-cadmium efflux system membrane fusion protein